MKSALERAMERFNLPDVQLSDEQKEQLAEIDRRYKAKEAEARLAADERIRNATTADTLDQARQELAIELASIERRCERDKQKVRDAAS